MLLHFSKAYDCIPHGLPIVKFEAYDYYKASEITSATGNKGQKYVPASVTGGM